MTPPDDGAAGRVSDRQPDTGNAGLIAAFGRWLRGLVFFILLPLVLIGLIGWYAAGPYIVSVAASGWLAERGLGPAAMDIRSLTATQADIVDLSIAGGAIKIPHLSVTYTIDGLRAGRIETATLTGFDGRAAIRDGRLVLGPLAPLADLSADGGEVTAPRFSQITVNDGAWQFATDVGAVSLQIDAELTVDARARLVGSANLDIDAPIGGTVVALDLDLDPARRDGDAYVSLSEAWLQMPELDMRGATGEVAVTLARGGIADIYGFVDHARLSHAVGAAVGSLTFHYDRRNAGLIGDFEALDGALAAHAEIAIDDIGGAGAQIESVGRLRLAGRALDPWRGIGAGPAKPARLSWTVAGAAPSLLDVIDAAALAAWIGGARFDGAIEAETPSLVLPGIAEGAGGAVGFDVSWSGDTLELAARHGQATVTGLDLEQLGLGSRIELLAPLRNTLAVELTSDSAARLNVQLDDIAAVAVDLTGVEMRVRGDRADLRAGLDAARLTRDLTSGGVRLESFTGARAAVTRWDMPVYGMAIDGLELALSGTPGRARGRLGVQAEGVPTLAGTDASVLPPLALDLDLGIDFAGNQLRLAPRSLAPLRIGEVALNADGLTLAPLTPVFDESVAAQVLLDLSGPGPISWRADAGLAPLAVDVTDATVPGTAMSVAGLTPPLVLSAGGSVSRDGAIHWSADGSGRGGRLRVTLPGEDPAAALALEAANIGIDWRADHTGAAVWRLDVPDLTQRGDRQFVAPLTLIADGRIPPGGGDLAFDLQLGDRSGALAIELNGRHEPGRRRGAGQLTVHPIHFFENGFQPTDLVPFLRDRLGTTTGRMSLSGDVFWSNRGVTGALDLIVEDLTTRVDEIDVIGVNGVVRFDRLWPPSTPPGQLVAVSAIDLGLPLTGGLITARLDKDGQPFIAYSEWRWAGGRVTTAGSRPHGPDGPDIVMLDIEGIELDQLLELTPEATNITATGRLNGRIPVVYRDGSFTIVDGWLESDFDGGTIKYDPKELSPGLLAGGDGVKLLLDALDDFHYSRLRIDVSGRGEGQVELRFRIRGANPALYGGAEFELNLTIEGALQQILRDSYRTYYELPDAVAEQLSRAKRRP